MVQDHLVMVDKDLKSFGTTLRQLRKAAGFYQEELAEKLSSIHAKVDPGTDLRLDGNRISKWERAFQDKQGREWKPKRQHVLYLIEAFVDQLTLETAQEWALQAGYRLDKEELQKIFLSRDASSDTPPSSVHQTNLERLDLFPDQPLFGVEQEREQIRLVLEHKKAPWLIAIDGIGGIGKTALANAVVREIVPTSRFRYVAWVSAKQEEFLTGSGLQRTNQPVLDPETFIDRLLEQLDDKVPLTRPSEEKLAILTRLLKQSSHLIVIDNLETVIDYQALLPLLGKLANPSKILLTSRHSLHDYSEVFCLNLKGLSKTDTFTFLKHEAETRGLPELLDDTSDAILESIYNVVGGNPLALKLVVGQIRVLSLAQVLENLEQAEGKKIEDLYIYIYWQAWQTLTPISREVLLAMPLAQGGTFTQIATVSQLTTHELHQALEQLFTLSLVEVKGDIKQRRYSIHRLTETFLLTEVTKWQSPP